MKLSNGMFQTLFFLLMTTKKKIYFNYYLSSVSVAEILVDFFIFLNYTRESFANKKGQKEVCVTFKLMILFVNSKGTAWRSLEKESKTMRGNFVTFDLHLRHKEVKNASNDDSKEHEA